MQERIAGDVLSLARIQLGGCEEKNPLTSRHAEFARDRDGPEKGGTQSSLGVCERGEDEEDRAGTRLWAYIRSRKGQWDQDGSSAIGTGEPLVEAELIIGRDESHNKWYGSEIRATLTPAIRFTASSDTRCITVRYDVSFFPPADDTCALPSSIGLPNVVPAPEDTPIWLFVSVRDTGPGLGPKELAMLFKRFSRE